MTVKGGYFKKHLHVDLSDGKAERLELSDAFVEKYIGGRGFGAKFVWDNLKKHNFKIDPLGPENLMVIAPGPLTGAYLPSSGKNSFVAISPATGLLAAPLGGYFTDRFGSIPVLLIIAFCAIPLVYLLGAVPSVAALAALMIAIGLVSNTRMPASENYIAANTPEHRRSTVFGIYFFAGTEVSALLTPVLGNLIDRFGFSFSFNIVGSVIAAWEIFQRG